MVFTPRVHDKPVIFDCHPTSMSLRKLTVDPTPPDLAMVCCPSGSEPYLAAEFQTRGQEGDAQGVGGQLALDCA